MTFWLSLTKPKDYARPSSSKARARNRCFCTLPDAVRGMPSVTMAVFGTLNLASRSAQWAITSSGVMVYPGTGITIVIERACGPEAGAPSHC